MDYMRVIYTGITAKIQAHIPNADIRVAETDQNRVEGLFYVVPVSINAQRVARYRQKIDVTMDIQFMAKSRTQAFDMARNISDWIEFIPDGQNEHGVLYGKNISETYVDRILHVIVNYTIHLIEPIENHVMERLSTTGGVHG